MTRLRYVVAVSEQQACILAADFGWGNPYDAVAHLDDWKTPIMGMPPKYYPSLYRVYTVEL